MVAIADVLGSVFACVCLSWPRMLVPNDVLLLHFRSCVSAQRWLWSSFRTYRFCICIRCIRYLDYLRAPGVAVTHAGKELPRSWLLACVTATPGANPSWRTGRHWSGSGACQHRAVLPEAKRQEEELLAGMFHCQEGGASRLCIRSPSCVAHARDTCRGLR